MRKQEFKLFIDTLNMIKDYSSDIVISDKKIFQMSDSRACIIDVDMTDLFDEQDYSEFITLMNITNKLDLFKILYGMLEKENDYVSFEKIDEQLRLSPSNSNFYVDFRLVGNSDYIESLLNVVNNLRDISKESEDDILTTVTFTKAEYKNFKKLQEKISASGLGFYYYNGKTLMFMDGNGTNATFGSWNVINGKYFKNDTMYRIQLLTDFIFPNVDSDIELSLYAANIRKNSDNFNVIAKSTGKLGNIVSFGMYSLYVVQTVMDEEERNAVLNRIE